MLKAILHRYLKAMGNNPFPRHLKLPDGDYELERVFKHDFFAATGLLKNTQCDGRKIVLKIGRYSGWERRRCGWLGRFLVRREADIYQALSDIPGVPKFVGWWGQNGFIHDYVSGCALKKGQRVGDEFFNQLESMIQTIHDRDMAYVDLEKCENIIVGDDGRPYLIDFQISWCAPGWWGSRFGPSIWFRKKLQHMDRYHLLKHRRRSRPDQLTLEQQKESNKVPWYIRIHRAAIRPLQKFRRGFLKKIDAHRDTPAH